jgi:hypothetical protein
MVSQADSNLYEHTRAYANYLDTLNRHAFGNYRNLLEDMALSPVMGIYLSHMRNRKEDPATGAARRELRARGDAAVHDRPAGAEPRRHAARSTPTAAGRDLHNADVMALAKVFTGWGWAFPDAQLTENRTSAGAARLQPWPPTRASTCSDEGLSQPALHRRLQPLFAGKPWAVTIPANTPRQRLRWRWTRCSTTPTSAPSSADS